MMRSILIICCIVDLQTEGHPMKKFQFGKRFNGMRSRIVGGKDAVPHAYPHMVSVQLHEDHVVRLKHICGGAIVSSFYVMTALHCVSNDPMDRLRVIAGAHNIFDDTENWQTRKLQQISTYQDPKKRYTDIALLKVAKAFELNVKVNVVKITNYDFTPKDGTWCSLTGWGLVKEQPPEYPKKLQMIYIPIVVGPKCDNLPLKRKVTPKIDICAGKNNGGACHADSGGPLLCPDKNSKIVLTGVLSRGDKPCGKSPAVFVRLGFLLNWINYVLKS